MPLRHVATRVLMALLTLLFVVTFNFFLFRAVGDPEKTLIRQKLSPEAKATLIHERGYDQPLLTQYRIYIGQLAQGDLGESFESDEPVIDELRTAIPNTLILVGGATLFATLLGSWMGIAAAWRRGKSRDAVLTQGSVALYSMPEFWLGMLLIYLLAVRFPIFPTGLKQTPGGAESGPEHWWDVARHAVLPILTLGLGLLAQYTLVMRASVTDTMREDFVTTARAIGLTPLQVRRRHIVPNAMLPLVTVIGLNFGLVLGGAIAVEALFSWPGLGFETITAIDEKDYPMLQGLFLVSSAAVIAANLIVDLVYTRLDPRVRTG